MTKIGWLKIVPAILIFIILTECTLFRKLPVEPSLKHLNYREVQLYDWTDDLAFKGMVPALEQSLRYYQKLPSWKVFQYGELTYSPEEMINSTRLFIDIIDAYEGKELQSQLKDKFLFFESRNSSGNSFFTGYYEPMLKGKHHPAGEYSEPLYKTPSDLVEVDLSLFSKKWKDEKIVGMLAKDQLIPYDSREEIVYNRSLEGRAEPIAYVKEIELFFLQIQGSGIISMPDGKLKRVNYAQKNGHPYRSIGRVLKDRIPSEQMSLQSIKEFLYNNPQEVKSVLSHNQSYTFFREVEEGPLGNIEVPLTPLRSIAMDSRVTPKGGLAYIETKIPLFENNQVVGLEKINRFVVVQDTGGAIRGHGRVDIYFGNGIDAELSAGHLKSVGRSFLIVARKEYVE